MDHDLLAASDEGGRAYDFLDTDEYVNADETFDAAAQEPEPHVFRTSRRVRSD